MYDAYGKCLVHTDYGDDETWLTSDDSTDTASAQGNPVFFTGQISVESALTYGCAESLGKIAKASFYSAEPVTKIVSSGVELGIVFVFIL